MKIIRHITLLIILILVLTPWLIFGQRSLSSLDIPASTTEIDGHTNAAGIRPGDTINLLPGEKLYLRVRYLHGTAEAPIVIINIQGLVAVTGFYYGIKLDSCSHIKITGRGVPSLNYGIMVFDIEGSGISIEGLSTDIELEGAEISYTSLAGIFAKSDPDCMFNSTRDKYTMRNLFIHDNYIHHTGMEGLYIGNTSYTGKVINCDGRDTLVYPHLIRNAKIYNNRVEHTGWDGIQVSCADSSCSINDNYIQYDSDSAYWNQMSGILAGGGSRCDCFNNVIKDGKGDGIDIFTLGGQYIYNNLIINSGKTFHPDSLLPYQKHGIYIGNNSTIPGTSYNIVYNTIIFPKNEGIKFDNLLSRNSIASNNIIINPGGFIYAGENAYIDVVSPAMEVLVENNFKSLNYQDAKFADPSLWNFDLQRYSPAVNAGTAVLGLTLSFDIMGRTRPFDSLNDIGAYECQDSSMIGISTLSKKELALELVAPNPFSNHLAIGWSVNTKTRVKISLLNINGFPVMELFNCDQPPGVYKITVITDALPGGFYFCRLETSKESVIKKIILVR